MNPRTPGKHTDLPGFVGSGGRLTPTPEQPMCVFSGDDCRGRLQWHHVIPRQRIRRAWKSACAAQGRGGPKAWILGDAIHDARNRVWLCVYHHGEVEAKRLYVTAPESAREFAAEYGFLAELEADELRASRLSGEREEAA